MGTFALIRLPLVTVWLVSWSCIPATPRTVEIGDVQSGAYSYAICSTASACDSPGTLKAIESGTLVLLDRQVTASELPAYLRNRPLWLDGVLPTGCFVREIHAGSSRGPGRKVRVGLLQWVSWPGDLVTLILPEAESGTFIIAERRGHQLVGGERVRTKLRVGVYVSKPRAFVAELIGRADPGLCARSLPETEDFSRAIP